MTWNIVFILYQLYLKTKFLHLTIIFENPVFASLFWNILYLSMFSSLFLFCVFFYGFSGYTGKDKRFNIEGQVEGI